MKSILTYFYFIIKLKLLSSSNKIRVYKLKICILRYIEILDIASYQENDKKRNNSLLSYSYFNIKLKLLNSLLNFQFKSLKLVFIIFETYRNF